MKNFIKEYARLFCVFLAISILINFLIFNMLFKPKRIAVVDMQAIVNEYTIKVANDNNINKEEAITKFAVKLNQTINDVALENNLIILPKQAVFSGADIDITEQFRGLMLNVK